MHTVSDILSNIDAGILAQNMMENMFSYRIIFFVNEESNGTKHYIDTTYGNLRKSLENIIREHLSVTNSSLLGRSYAFSLDGYFQKICEEKVENTNSSYGRRMAQWC